MPALSPDWTARQASAAVPSPVLYDHLKGRSSLATLLHQFFPLRMEVVMKLVTIPTVAFAHVIQAIAGHAALWTGDCLFQFVPSSSFCREFCHFSSRSLISGKISSMSGAVAVSNFASVSCSSVSWPKF